MAQHILLCLKCRKPGHNVKNCKIDEWPDESDVRRSEGEGEYEAAVLALSSNIGHYSCANCQRLDLATLFRDPPPWNSQADFVDDLDAMEDDLEKSLGSVQDVEFVANCPICCCLFMVTPTPSSENQEILLIPDWTISRVSGELGAVTMDTPEKRQYATCILSVLRPSTSSLPPRILAHRGDALCLLEEDIGPGRSLGGRYIDATVINADLILDWVKQCERLHDKSCRPVQTAALSEIRLIDVEDRKIVPYPSVHCEYIALSYVWGGIPQDRYILGNTVKQLPQTLEDALVFARLLGRRYVWIDSVCIDQNDQDDKSNQIDRMSSIYQGAWITLIVLSGVAADSGISRISHKSRHPQLQCKLSDGATVVSLTPTLSQQIWSSPWGQRAWTLQEGLLSPRCLYISDHQVYYDCSSMQCCESLMESKSWAHGLSPKDNHTEEGFVTWMLRQAGAGALRIPLDWPSRRLEHWGEKLNLYSYRSMTYEVDALRAFNGVLQRLEEIYPKGFWCGIPMEDFDWGLSWASQVPPKSRRSGFPSWSWAGWEGPLFFGQPIDVEKTRRIGTPLTVRGLDNGALVIVFQGQIEGSIDGSSIGLVIFNDPVAHASTKEISAHLDLTQYPMAEKHRYLFVDAVCFHFVPDFSSPQRKIYASGQNETFSFIVNGVICHIRIFSTDRFITGKWVQTGPGEFTWTVDSGRQQQRVFMLLARDHWRGHILHKLLMLEMIDDALGIAERATVLELLVPLDELEVLRMFEPRRRTIILK